MENHPFGKVDNVFLLEKYNEKNPSKGNLFLTNTSLTFLDGNDKIEKWISHSLIINVEKLPANSLGFVLRINCKTFDSLTFVIPREKDCHDLYVSLQKLCRPAHFPDLFCFNYRDVKNSIAKKVGWNFFVLENDFQRMNLPNRHWSFSKLNADYRVCDTYPKVVVVPAKASDSILVGSSSFRSKNRFPALTYLHANEAAICRCAQPLSGFKARCDDDERLLDAVFATNPNGLFSYVVDTRPKINAFANKATGKGYENEAFYENIKYCSFGIPNIHVMRGSLQKIIETVDLKNGTMNTFLSGIDSSNWLKHIKTILETAQFVADKIVCGHHVIVHCSDGWDRTAQVCSLAQLLLDPYYRTLQGFQALIEKDWLAFGHKFTERCGHIICDSRFISPIFTQFLDCTWQLMNQFPFEFQFNEHFLCIIHEHMMTCKYGTFVGNCDKDRHDLQLAEKTYSLWGLLAMNLPEYMNPKYSADENGNCDVLVTNLSPQNIKFWRGMYCRYDNGVQPRESIDEALLATLNHSTALKSHLAFLKKAFDASKSYFSKPREIAVDPLTAHLHETDTKGENDGGGGSGSGSGNERTQNIHDLVQEFDAINIDWESIHNITECKCSTQFDSVRKKYHCWKCGGVYCSRCMEKSFIDPAYFGRKEIPVCGSCFGKINSSK